MVRAVVEGIAHNLGWLLPHVETFTGKADRRRRVRRRRGAVRANGARSSPTCSTARCPRWRLPTARSPRATALLALERHGVLTSSDLDAAVDIAHRYDPDPAQHERYAYRQTQFEAAHAALLPISEALQ